MHARHFLSSLVLGIGICLSLTFGSYGDPNPHVWEKWKTDFAKRDVDFGEILSGGPPKDGIPSIDDPQFISMAEASEKYADVEPVIGLEINGDARAYPLSVLMWHEIANDVVGGQAVTVTFCPLCNSALVYDANVEGKRHEFGTTGRLRNSDLVMYDRVTESWWQQFSGRALIGDYVGKKLKIVPSRLESFAKFKERFPNGKVLVPNNPGLRDYGRNPYAFYDSADQPFLYRGEMPEGIDPMVRVIIPRDGNAKPVIVTMDKVRKNSPLSVGDITISWTPGQASALDDGRIANGKDVGNIVVTRMANGSAQDLPYDVTFAFVAHAFHPDVTIEK